MTICLRKKIETDLLSWYNDIVPDQMSDTLHHCEYTMRPPGIADRDLDGKYNEIPLSAKLRIKKRRRFHA